MKVRIVSALSLALLILMLGLAACDQGSTAPNEVSMSAGDFSTTSVTIKAGQAVHFTDPAGIGGPHTICLGANGACDETAQGPLALTGDGFTMNPGDPAKDVTFDTPGTYKITCSIHPAMNLTVVVQ
ncbi:MAG TPA: plastocyanin/azurin family copper-binding protein [Ktedonobacterales bacterium]